MRVHWQHADGWTGDRIAPLGAHPATLPHPRAGTRVRARLDAAATRVSWRIGRRPWQRASGTRRSWSLPAAARAGQTLSLAVRYAAGDGARFALAVS